MSEPVTGMVVAPGAGVQQSFGSQSIERAHETASTAVAAQARAAIEARYVMALRNPRDWDSVRQRLLAECRRPSFAEVARYRKPVGKGIEGLSIRFVEAALRAMTNVLVETAAIYDDHIKRIVRVSATDLETNVCYPKDIVIEKTVERRQLKGAQRAVSTRTGSTGDTVYIVEATEDEILNKQNALESKAIRTLGLRLIPGDLQDEAEQLCIATMQNADAKDPDAAKKKLADAFLSVGVPVELLVEYLGHDLAQSVPAELDELRAVFSAIKDGEARWSDALESKMAERGAVPDEKEVARIQSTPASKAIRERLAKRNEK